MNREDARKRIDELKEITAYHAKRYYDDDDPEISDFEYDMLMLELRNLENQFPDLITSDSLTQHVGGTVKEGFEKGISEYMTLSIARFGYSPRHFVDPNSEFINKLMNAYQEISGDYESKPFTIGGGTYARIMKNAVAYGPNFLHRPDLCHQPDEHIYLSDFILWIAIYAKAIYLLAK